MNENTTVEPADEPTPAEPDAESVDATADPVRMTAFALLDASRVGQLLVSLSGLLLVGGTLGAEPRPPALRTLGLVGFALAAGWATSWVTRIASALLHHLADRSVTAAKLDGRLDALAEAVGAIKLSSAPAAVAADVERKAVAHAEIRRAVRESRWADAVAAVDDFAEAFPGDTSIDRLRDDLAKARLEAAGSLTGKLFAARETGDADRVIELREALKPVAEPGSLDGLDRDLAKWFMTVIHRRLRTGTARPDVVALAGRVSDALDGTPEGASLRASLPTLRRAAGLCPRCAQPYKGVAEACPECIARAVAVTSTAAPTTPIAEPVTEDDPDDLPSEPVESIFVHDDFDDQPEAGPYTNGSFPSDKTKDS